MQLVLCIDDEVMSLALRKLLLETQGYRVLTATAGPAAVEMARKYNLDAVVLDFQMPVMNGEQIARILKRERPTLPIILLTGQAESDIPHATLSLVDLYVQKGSGDLLASLHTILNSKTTKRPPASVPREILGRESTHRFPARIQ